MLISNKRLTEMKDADLFNRKKERKEKKNEKEKEKKKMRKKTLFWSYA